MTHVRAALAAAVMIAGLGVVAPIAQQSAPHAPAPPAPQDQRPAVFWGVANFVYVDAYPRRRALRRHEELLERGEDADVETIEKEIRARDHADSTRKDSPLVRAPDAVLDVAGVSAGPRG